MGGVCRYRDNRRRNRCPTAFLRFRNWRDEYSDDTNSAGVRVAIIEPDWIAGTYEVDLAVVLTLAWSRRQRQLERGVSKRKRPDRCNPFLKS